MRARYIIIDVIILAIVLALAITVNARGSTLFLGDSLGVGTAPYVKVASMKVDVRGSRPLAEGMKHLGFYGHQDRLMVSLFTNDHPSRVSQIRRAVRYSLRRADCIVWATIYVRHLDYSRANRFIRHRAGRRFKVVDWNKMMRRHPEYSSDGIHPDVHGYYVRSRMYVRALHRCPGKQGD